MCALTVRRPGGPATKREPSPEGLGIVGDGPSAVGAALYRNCSLGITVFTPASPGRLEAPPPFVIPSEAGFPTTRHWTRQRVRLSVKKGAWSLPKPPNSTGNPG